MAQENQKPKPKMVEYVTTKDRYIYDSYVRATPDSPAVILLPEGTKEKPPHLRLKRGEVEAPPLAPHHAPGSKGPQPMAHARDRAPERPSDREPTR